MVATSRIRPSNCPVLALDQPPVGEAEEMELPGFQMGHEPSMEALEQHPIGIEHRPHPQVGPEVDQELLERSVRAWMRLRVLIQPCC